MLNYHFAQLDVVGYHVVNLLIHTGSAFLVWWLSSLIFSTPVMERESGEKSRLSLRALSVALIFLAHPLQTESVTYICQRSTSLAALFYLLSLCLYLKGRYAASWFSCLAAMFSKETAVTLPLMILLAEFYFVRQGWVRWKKLLLFLVLLPLVSGVFFLAKPKTFVDMQVALGFSDLLVTGIPTQMRVMLTYLRLLVLRSARTLITIILCIGVSFSPLSWRELSPWRGFCSPRCGCSGSIGWFRSGSRGFLSRWGSRWETRSSSTGSTWPLWVSPLFWPAAYMNCTRKEPAGSRIRRLWRLLSFFPC